MAHITTGEVGPFYRTRVMQSRQTVHITAAEWRWVIVMSFLLVLLAFAPLMWVAVRGTGDWQFMGVLHNYRDGATYLSKMALGENGDWLMHFLHTPDTHGGALIQTLYIGLGHVARLSGVPSVVLFHVARMGAALMMYITLYQLGASIWARVRSRRLFFGIASIGAGFGWLFGSLTRTVEFPDFVLLPEAFPFYSSLVNVHFSLTIAFLALLAGLFITVFRPGADEDTTVLYGWPVAVLLTVLLAMLYPQALVPISGAVVVSAGVMAWREKRVPAYILRWVLAVIVPAVPFALYYAAVVTYNPAFAEWNRQNVTKAPPLWMMVVGFGLPLLLGIPAVIRAVRRFERDGDRLMLLWGVAILVMTYFPTNVQRRFAVGLMIPIAYFATRALEDVWLPRISYRWRRWVYVALFPVIAISSLLTLFIPIIPVIAGQPQAAVGIFLQRDYVAAFSWINQRTTVNDVVVASPLVGAWIPAWAGTRTVYGHPYETLQAAEREAEIEAWYSGAADCERLIERYDVDFILYGTEEAKLGDGACLGGLREMVRFGNVSIYAP